MKLYNNPRTCTSCGYTIDQCLCGKPRNTSGDVVKFPNYNDLRNNNDYSLTGRVNRSDPETRKIMEELNPIDGENLDNFIQRTIIAEEKLCEYSMQHHMYGTKKAWACHTTSRYCFICTLVQFVNVHRMILETYPEPTKKKLKIGDDGQIYII